MTIERRPILERFERLYFAARESSLARNPTFIAQMNGETLKKLGRELERGGIDMPPGTAEACASLAERAGPTGIKLWGVEIHIDRLRNTDDLTISSSPHAKQR